MIHLEKVTEHTFRTLVKMKLPEAQSRFVAPNVYSIAQAWLYPEEARPYAVMNDDEPVGFLMLDWDEETRTLGVWRFMIAEEHQRKGYGRAAMEEVIRIAKKCGKFDLVGLDYVPGNTAARALYYSLGFRETGDVEDNEVIMALPLTEHPSVCVLTADEDDMEEFETLLQKEQDAGNPVPALFADKTSLAEAVAAGRVTRFTAMGDTIALFADKTLFVQGKSEQYRARILEILAERE